MNKIDLDLDNENEMTFNVVIEGTRPGDPFADLVFNTLMIHVLQERSNKFLLAIFFNTLRFSIC